jgi:hypothetical protein
MKTLTRRRRKIIAVTASVFLLAVASAAAYYLILADGSGEGSATLGTGTAEPLTLTATFANGLTPGHEEPIVFKAVNSTKVEAEVATLTASVSSTSGLCDGHYFSVEGGDGGLTGGPLTTPVMIAPGETKVVGANDEIKFKEEPTVNQSGCESTVINVQVSSTP